MTQVMWGDDIRHAREAAGISQAELARRARLSRRHLTLIEKNGNVSLETIAKILDVLPGLRRLTIGSHQIAFGVSSEQHTRVEEIHRTLETIVHEAIKARDVAKQVLQPAREPLDQLILRNFNALSDEKKAEFMEAGARLAADRARRGEESVDQLLRQTRAMPAPQPEHATKKRKKA